MPPLTVWLLAAQVSLPLAALFGWMMYLGELDAGGLFGAALGLPLAVALLAGLRAGWWLTAVAAVGYLALNQIGVAVFLAVGPANPAGQRVLAVAAAFTLTAGFLLWWPDTRRWCRTFAPPAVPA